jgi:hypothetical protein
MTTMQNNIESTEPRMIGALSVMVKAVGQSGESSYKDKLKVLSQLAQHPKLRRQFDVAIEMLSQGSELDEEEEAEEEEA